MNLIVANVFRRFLVFEYDAYMELGALDDVVNSFDTMEEARDFVRRRIGELPDGTWAILDCEERKSWGVEK